MASIARRVPKVQQKTAEICVAIGEMALPHFLGKTAGVCFSRNGRPCGSAGADRCAARAAVPACARRSARRAPTPRAPPESTPALALGSGCEKCRDIRRERLRVFPMHWQLDPNGCIGMELTHVRLDTSAGRHVRGSREVRRGRMGVRGGPGRRVGRKALRPLGPPAVCPSPATHAILTL